MPVTDSAEPPVRRVSSRIAYRNPWLTVREDGIEYPDGTTSIYGIVEKPDFALVLPRGDGGFWLVNQFRYPVGRRMWEFPQGSWGEGSTGSQVALAHAELEEETGLRASAMHHLGRVVHAQGISATQFDVFVAEGLSQGTPRRESTEQDMVHRFVTDDELDAMLRSGEVNDAPSLAALSLFRLRG